MEKDRGKYRIAVLKVNGEEHSVAVKDGETLLDVLRDKLGLTGTKKGCNLGVCGACTVLVDGEPKNSCLLLAASCEGAEITTIEGVDQEGKMHPLQRAFIDHGAIQCGLSNPVRFLYARDDTQRCSADKMQSRPIRGGNKGSFLRKSLPLHRLHAHY